MGSPGIATRRGMKMKTVEEILADERAGQEAFEAATEHRGHRIADLRRVLNAIQDVDDWKGPWAAAVPWQLVSMVQAAVEYCHASPAHVIGAERVTGRVLMRGPGYQG